MKPIGKGQSFIVWGAATHDARAYTTSGGKSKTLFSIAYNRYKDQDGEKHTDFMDVETWGPLADYAAGIEKGDVLLLGGQYVKDEYMSKKKGEERWKLVAEIVLVQPTAMAEEPDPGYSEPEEPEPDDGGWQEVEDSDGELPF